jgi:solute carrier family 25 phosphate transporter 23/24/25/41
MLAGAFAGVCSVTATYPLDLIRTRLSLPASGTGSLSIMACARQIYATEGGVRALYRGLGPTLAGIAPYVALNFTVYEGLKASVKDLKLARNLSVKSVVLTGNLSLNGVMPIGNPNLSVMEQTFGDIERARKLELESNLGIVEKLACGGAAGAVAQTFTYPLDVIRRRMQVCASKAVSYQHATALDAFMYILRNDGITGLFKGMLPNYLKVVPAISLSFVTFEFVKAQLMVDE